MRTCRCCAASALDGFHQSLSQDFYAQGFPVLLVEGLDSAWTYQDGQHSPVGKVIRMGC